jgi:hypothetical protein
VTHSIFCYAERRVLFIVTMSDIMLSVVMTGVLVLLDLITDFGSDATINTLQYFRLDNKIMECKI